MIGSLIFAVVFGGQTGDRFQEARQFLTQGVDRIEAPGALPGRAVADGKNSFVFLTGMANDVPAPIGVASQLGGGRAAAIGHGSFFDASNLKLNSNHALFDHLLQWLSGKTLANVRVGTFDASQLTQLGAVDGFSVVSLSKSSLVAQLANLDVLMVDQGMLDDSGPDQSAVISFVKSGHGLLVFGPGWGWQQLNPLKDLRTQLSANKMLLPYGIGFSGATVDGPYGVSNNDDLALTTDGAVTTLDQSPSDPKQIAESSNSLQAALSLMPVTDNPLASDIDEKAKLEGTGDGPTPEKPFTYKTPFSRLKARMDYEASLVEPSSKVMAYPSAHIFPGPVEKGAKRISKVVLINPQVPDWKSTGLYAAPGEEIEIQVPNSAIQAGLGIRIGPHTDELWDLDKWERFPAISQYWHLKAPSTYVASPFGGLVYIDVPDHLSQAQIPIKISGAVMAPLYEKNKTTNAEWAAMLRTTGAPWAELQGDLVTLSVPIKSARFAEDPKALMVYWDEVLTDCYKFFAAPRRPRQERYCPDQEISAGYMHSGYPIMTWLDVADRFCTLSKLRGKGGQTWGFYHEMGHNFQQGDWTFDGTGEVTNNLFSLYGSEALNAATPDTYQLAHPDMGVAVRQSRLAKYLAAGAPYQQWMNDPFLALTMYAQLRIAFGWNAFTAVFAEYETLKLDEHPKTDLDKRDQWMVRFSRQIHKNLGPFFQKWGVPTSEKARRSIEDLPAWAGDQWPTTTATATR